MTIQPNFALVALRATKGRCGLFPQHERARYRERSDRTLSPSKLTMNVVKVGKIGCLTATETLDQPQQIERSCLTRDRVCGNRKSSHPYGNVPVVATTNGSSAYSRCVCTVIHNKVRNAQPRTTNATYLSILAVLSPLTLYNCGAAQRRMGIKHRRSAGEQRKAPT